MKMLNSIAIETAEEKFGFEFDRNSKSCHVKLQLRLKKQKQMLETETDLKIPLLKTFSYRGQKAFSYRCRKLWNNLENATKLAQLPENLQGTAIVGDNFNFIFKFSFFSLSFI